MTRKSRGSETGGAETGSNTGGAAQTGGLDAGGGIAPVGTAGAAGAESLTVRPEDRQRSPGDTCVRAMVQCSCACGVPTNSAYWDPYLAAYDVMCENYAGPWCGMNCGEVECRDGMCVETASPTLNPAAKGIWHYRWTGDNISFVQIALCDNGKARLLHGLTPTDPAPDIFEGTYVLLSSPPDRISATFEGTWRPASVSIRPRHPGTPRI